MLPSGRAARAGPYAPRPPIARFRRARGAAQAYASQGDYEYRSRLWNTLSIGLNNQTLHHVFPSVHPCHYPALTELIEPVFRKYQLPMGGWSQSFWYSLAQHWKHMCVLDAFRFDTATRKFQRTERSLGGEGGAF